MNEVQQIVALREQMVASQLAARGISNERVLGALREVPRERFVSAGNAEFAYLDSALPIGHEQTISQPYIVALTAQALAIGPEARVLEIGTGSGYAAAVLSQIAAEVFTVERIGALAQTARARLEQLGYTNVHVRCADGTLGWPEHAPYQGIAVAAASPRLPPKLLAQLALGGRIVIPVGDGRSQELLVLTRTAECEFKRTVLTDVRFVPLIGAEGAGHSGV